MRRRLLRPANTLRISFVVTMLAGVRAEEVATPCENSVTIIFQEEGIPESPHQSSELYIGQSRVIEMRRGVVTTFYVALVSNLRDRLDWDGLTLWQLSLGLDGDVAVTDARVEGTAAATEPDGLRSPVSFELTEVVDSDRISPITGKPQGKGVVSGIVLFSEQLDSVGTATVLAIDVMPRKEAANGEIGRITCRNGLIGSGRPVQNVWMVEGPADSFCECSDAMLVLQTTAAFIRGDANDDGDVGLADAVRILRALFGGPDAPQTICREPFDVNADGRVNITDSIYLLSFKFQGTAPPPAPFPDCGWADIPQEECPLESTTCP